MREPCRFVGSAPISRYRHNLTGEDNGDAHLKRQVMGREVVVAITNRRLDDSAEPSGRASGRGLIEASYSVIERARQHGFAFGLVSQGHLLKPCCPALAQMTRYADFIQLGCNSGPNLLVDWR